jgi:hypothetical protein
MISIPVIASGIDWWISVSFLFGIKVVECLLSKNIDGNDVTSCVFLSMMLFKVMKVSPQ